MPPLLPAIPVSLFIGIVGQFPDNGRPTAIYKSPVEEPLLLTATGFSGDQQADQRVHGGPEKAVHLYPANHYALLSRHFPQAASLFLPGSMGENLSTLDLDENIVRLGDVFSLGRAQLQVSQPRTPCWKIDARFGCDGIAAHIAETGLSGWYLRVLEPGMVSPGDSLLLQQTEASAPALATAIATLRAHRPPLAELEAIAAAPAIAPGWQKKILERIEWLRRHAASPVPR